jgi:hypothetical protein
MHFSPKGGNEDDSDDDENFNFAKIDATQGETQDKKVIEAKILISKQYKEISKNHWKVSEHCKHKLNPAQKFIKSLSNNLREALYYKYLQTSDHYH